MTNLTAVAAWDDVPQLETTTPALGGPGGPMNLQAQALLNRTQRLNLKAVVQDDPGRFLTFIVAGEPSAYGDIRYRLNLGNREVPDNEKDRAFHVEATLPTRVGSDERRELMAYSYTLETNHHGPFGGEIRGIKGIVRGNGGGSNLRSAHFVTQGNNGHNGDLTGVLSDVFRWDISPGAAAVGVRTCAFLGQVGAGIRDVFLARSRLNPGDSTPQTADFIYRQEGESINNPLLARVASFQAHGGGGGSLFRGLKSHTDSAVVWDVRASGAQLARSYCSGRIVALADDAVATLTPPAATGFLEIHAEDTSAAWARVYFRAGASVAIGVCYAGAQFSGGTTVLTAGTGDGIDGNLNVHVSTDGLIYVKNRTALARDITFTFNSAP
jgi:hypothetical protein